MKYPLYYVDTSGCITSVEEWCSITGWPEDEWMGLKMVDVLEVLKLYDLTLNPYALLAHEAYEAGLDAGFAAAAEVYRA